MQEHDLNPFTKQPHSAQYKKILETRKKLPVYGQMDDFMRIVSTVSHYSGEEGFELFHLESLLPPGLSFICS